MSSNNNLAFDPILSKMLAHLPEDLLFERLQKYIIQHKKEQSGASRQRLSHLVFHLGIRLSDQGNTPEHVDDLIKKTERDHDWLNLIPSDN